MACFRGISLMLFVVAAVRASNVESNQQVPIPYAAQNYGEVDQSGASSDHGSIVTPNNYIQHYGQSSPEGYQLQSGFEGYIVPALASAYGVSHIKPGVLESLKPYALKFIAVLPKIAVAVIAVVGLLVLGTLLTTGLCAYTSVCHLSFLGVKLTGESVRSLVTPDRLSEMTSFLQSAIKKYQEMNAIKSNEVK